jgi:hypothetical protein
MKIEMKTIMDERSENRLLERVETYEEWTEKLEKAIEDIEAGDYELYDNAEDFLNSL